MKTRTFFLSLLLLCALTACGKDDAPATSYEPPEDGSPIVQVMPGGSFGSVRAETPEEAPSQAEPSVPAEPSEPAGPDASSAPSVQPSPAPPEESAAPSPQAEPQDPVMAAYIAALKGLYYDHIYPNGDILPPSDYNYSDLNLNQFAIFDVDGDGEDELLFLFSTTITAGMQLIVYRYDTGFPGSLMVELAEFPNVTFYDNGIVQAGMSHNHSKGMDLWPYFLYRYDPIQDSYVYVSSVQSWEKEFYPENFPDDVDADGDGTVYFVNDENQPIDGSAYQAWCDSWIGGAQTLDVPYQDFTPENIAALQ